MNLTTRLASDEGTTTLVSADGLTLAVAALATCLLVRWIGQAWRKRPGEADGKHS